MVRRVADDFLLGEVSVSTGIDSELEWEKSTAIFRKKVKLFGESVGCFLDVSQQRGIAGPNCRRTQFRGINSHTSPGRTA